MLSVVKREWLITLAFLSLSPGLSMDHLRDNPKDLSKTLGRP